MVYGSPSIINFMPFLNSLVLTVAIRASVE
jgi:hypothetical protein